MSTVSLARFTSKDPWGEKQSQSGRKADWLIHGSPYDNATIGDDTILIY